jgi:hypothetical protein
MPTPHACSHLGVPIKSNGVSHTKTILLHQGREVVLCKEGLGNLKEIESKFGSAPGIFLRSVRARVNTSSVELPAPHPPCEYCPKVDSP